MKNRDITSRVMKSVARYERERVSRWFAVFLVTILALLFAFSVAIGVAIRDMVERQAFEPLSILFEDREIIAEYWGDVASIFLTEIPVDYLVAGLAVLLGIAAAVILTRHRRRVLRKRIETLEKYS